jgi:sulfhydrogenase subunit alpha
MESRTIKVDYLARVEGEGALTIRYRGREVDSCELRIFEPPRFFEAFLRGRSQLEVPDITARICGICPVAYMMSACNAIERAHGMTIDPSVRALRRLLYCGEWIESHVLHMAMLHAPDFLGLPDAVAIAKAHPEQVKRGLRLKKAGNAVMRLLGGREIHPINVRVGGFYRAPTKAELETLLPELRWGRDAACELVDWLATLPFPALERDREYVALRHPDEYAIGDGRIVSTGGLDIDASEYDACFVEEHVARSNALHSTIRGRGAYLCGPLARFHVSYELLSPLARRVAKDAGIEPPMRNPFKSLLVRGVEVVYAFDEAVRIIESYAPPERPFVEAPTRASCGSGVTEAPRGMLYHRYALDDAGLVLDAKIVPPTSQNQRSFEEDLYALAPALLDLPQAEATLRAEQAIRNHDPCISCATHFLTLRIEREEPA